ncbi:hypothetical protein [Pararobbsia alpina]|uniref:Uncharacterized protein n=1 Tax=Pararobbsia alpina TaxID=621374 RepID=A0A6S7B069_9BURK|nr:hypothetical protein [Pararobbsia alpina]CAB3783395.1 hypothetical protein LMG28138_01631 [Pararobbsia alpina]
MRPLQLIDDAVDKATSLYGRYCKRNSYLFDQPSRYSSDVEEVSCQQYVVLRSGSDLLAAYRINRESGRLRMVATEKVPKSILRTTAAPAKWFPDVVVGTEK